MGLGYTPAMDQLLSLVPGATPSLEAELVLAARAGDRAAYGRLYDRFAPMVHGVLLARVTGAPHPEGDALAVLASIQRLPEAYRETLVLRLVEGMTGPEIAERTGLTPGSVRVNLHRGLQLLRDALGGKDRT